MQATASITVTELCQLVADAAYAIDGLLVKHTGHDINGLPDDYAFYAHIMPNLLDLYGRLNHLSNELDTHECQRNAVIVPIK